MQGRNVLFAVCHLGFPVLEGFLKGLDLAGKGFDRFGSQAGLGDLEFPAALRRVAYEDEADVFLILRDDRSGILLDPGGIEFFHRDGIVVEGAACLFQRLELRGIHVAPLLLFFQGSGGGGQLGAQCGVLCILAEVTALDRLDLAADVFGFPVQSRGIRIHGFAGARDVEHAKCLYFMEEGFRIAAQEQERVFGHFGDHASASSSSSS